MDEFPLRVRLNGQERHIEVRPHELLVDVIRDRFGLTGTKKSCELGICGACTVLVEGRAVTSCCLFAFEVNDKELLTIEGLSAGDTLHPLQESFIEFGGFQCGFCTPGMVLTAKMLLDENPNPTVAEIKRHMNANICRCTGYQMIVESIADAAAKLRGASS